MASEVVILVVSPMGICVTLRVTVQEEGQSCTEPLPLISGQFVGVAGQTGKKLYASSVRDSVGVVMLGYFTCNGVGDVGGETPGIGICELFTGDADETERVYNKKKLKIELSPYVLANMKIPFSIV
jgi:hypothetical protein